MWPKFGNSSISMREVIIASILSEIDQKNQLFEGWSWFKFHDLGLALVMDYKFCTSGLKELNLKVKKISGLISTFVGVTCENLLWGYFATPPLPTILNKAEFSFHSNKSKYPNLHFFNQSTNRWKIREMVWIFKMLPILWWRNSK